MSTSGGVAVNAGSSDAAEDEEQDDSSSVHTENDENQNIEEVLSNFRDLWHKEITNETVDKERFEPNQTSSGRLEEDTEEQARRLFLQGVEMEQKGRTYEAIQFYRRAVQLVPDIEFKLYDSARNASKERASEVLDNQSVETPADGNNSEDDEGSVDGSVDLSVRLQGWMARATSLCVPAQEQRSTHISSLPMEILLLILRWVVSCDLDIRSLETCSLVCRGFYMCSRDSEIWRLICLRLWGVNCGGLGNHLSWRDMYMQRPHLNFGGCYISKTSYVRHGENSFQDQFYRPWHVVEYFRYIRFFPEGKVLMMTTPDGPLPMLGHLRHRNAKYPAVLIGHYRLHDDHVSLVLRRGEREPRALANNRFRGRQNRQSPEHFEQTSNIELQVKPYKGQMNCQLAWTRYMVFTRRGATETATNFEVLSSKFPPFRFSRVKSYCGESELPLV